jgi:hypothetical protein
VAPCHVSTEAWARPGSESGQKEVRRARADSGSGPPALDRPIIPGAGPTQATMVTGRCPAGGPPPPAFASAASSPHDTAPRRRAFNARSRPVPSRYPCTVCSTPLAEEQHWAGLAKLTKAIQWLHPEACIRQ